MEKDPKDNSDSETKKNKEKDDIEELLKNNPGYGYWKREEDLIDRDKFIPKPIDNVDTNKLVLESKTSVGSAWNTAGTWEEKHYKKSSIEDFFNEKIKGITIDGLKFESIKNYSGDAYTVFVRQKAKLVYDCNFTLELSYKNDESAELEINDVNNHELDAEFEFNYKKMDSSTIATVKKNKKKIEDFIRDLFVNFWESQRK